MRKPGTPAKALRYVRGVLSPFPWSCLIGTGGLDVRGRGGDDVMLLVFATRAQVPSPSLPRPSDVENV